MPAATPRKTAAKKAAAIKAIQEPPNDLDAMRAEVAAEPDAVEDETYVVPLAGTTVRIKNVLDWPLSCDDLLRAQMFNQWARKVLVDEDRQVWEGVDPSLRVFAAFMKDLETISGIPFGLELVSPTT